MMVAQFNNDDRNAYDLVFLVVKNNILTMHTLGTIHVPEYYKFNPRKHTFRWSSK